MIGHLSEIAKAGDEKSDNPIQDVDGAGEQRKILLGRSRPGPNLDAEFLFWSGECVRSAGHPSGSR